MFPEWICKSKGGLILSEDKKQMYFSLTMGYIGVLFVVLTGFRMVWIDDSMGSILVLMSLIFIRGFWRYVEEKFIPETRERRIIKSVFLSMLFIVFLGGCYLLFK
ncbi:hypothetical protein GLW04_13870 [Halobacillus litoralis]|uniref:DUF4181 domain-containing protein n=1 Tax=Halobacillus litoralis TaxID=45668 RepID=A0A845E423_9BACI|nr:hypothetical protein [Halobacillus litoralis]